MEPNTLARILAVDDKARADNPRMVRVVPSTFGLWRVVRGPAGADVLFDGFSHKAEGSRWALARGFVLEN